VERELQTYISAGFDGWILKPIDFKRLNVLLSGIVSEDVRNECLYKPGKWERGGWFEKRQADAFAADTRPSASGGIASIDGAGEEESHNEVDGEVKGLIDGVPHDEEVDGGVKGLIDGVNDINV